MQQLHRGHNLDFRRGSQSIKLLSLPREVVKAATQLRDTALASAIRQEVVRYLVTVPPTGGSGGGLLTNWIITHTDRFKAAAAQKPVINWASMALTSASQTILPSTIAVPLYHHIFLRWLVFFM